jgi:general stress protein YciG
LEIFDYTDEGYCKAFEVEKRLIKQVLNDKWCLNENVGGVMSLSSVRKVGENHFKNGTGCFSLSKEERIKLSKEIVERNRKNKTGLFGMNKKQILDAAKLGGQKSFEMKTGIFSLTEQQIKELNQKLKEEKRGIYGISKERRKEIGRMSGKKSAKIINSQRWECSETGYISTPAGLTHYQKSRGIDTSKRNRIK